MGHSLFMIQFSRFFFPKRLETDPPTVMYGKEPLYLMSVNSKAATVIEIPVYTSHLRQKRAEVYD